MKKLLFILLFVPVLLFGQTSVPNTETFSLQDVYNAVHAHTGGTQTNLQSCFDNAISGYFNATYNQDSYAPANSMLRFRDYKPTADPCDYTQITLWTQIQVSDCGVYSFTGSLASATQACSDANNASCKTNGFVINGTDYKIESVDVGKQLYSIVGSCGISTFTGYALWNTGQPGTSGTWYIIHTTNGIIDLKTQCYP